MPRLSDGQLASVVLQAGWKDHDAAIAFSTARAESSGIPERIGIVDKDDLGLFQINRRHHPEVDKINWRDPQENARLAYTIWTQRGWNEWTAVRQGRYLAYMGIAETALKANPAGNVPIPSGGGIGLPGASEFASVFDFLRLVSSRDTWIRVGKILAGILMVAIGIFYLAKPIIKPAVKTAIAAARTAPGVP